MQTLSEEVGGQYIDFADTRCARVRIMRKLGLFMEEQPAWYGLLVLSSQGTPTTFANTAIAVRRSFFRKADYRNYIDLLTEAVGLPRRRVGQIV
jgi:hypothetical protein